jgi:hypothetical protein
MDTGTLWMLAGRENTGISFAAFADPNIGDLLGDLSPEASTTSTLALAFAETSTRALPYCTVHNKFGVNLNFLSRTSCRNKKNS